MQFYGFIFRSDFQRGNFLRNSVDHIRFSNNNLFQIELKQEQRFPMLVKRIEKLEANVEALKMEHDILYANSLKTDE